MGVLRMNDIYSIDLTRTLPISLKNDPKMIALSEIIATELLKTSKLIKNNIIYARIDELNEGTLDILAYDLHVDWYEYTYPIEAKRAIIKDSVKVHKRLGTTNAVEMALGNLHPGSEIEEWFEYDGDPFSFRIVIDVTNSRTTAEYFSIIKAVNTYKRLAAHLDSLVYQCSIGFEIATMGEYFKFKSSLTGMNNAGELPYRNIIGNIAYSDIQIDPDSVNYKFNSEVSGTKPQRNVIGNIIYNDIQINPDSEKYKFKSSTAGENNVGEVPYRNIVGNATYSDIQINPDSENYRFNVSAAGESNVGELPYKNSKGVIGSGGITPTATAESYTYNVKRCGTKISRN